MNTDTPTPSEAAFAAAEEIKDLLRNVESVDDWSAEILEIIARHTTPAPAVTPATADEGLRTKARSLVQIWKHSESEAFEDEINEKICDLSDELAHLDATPSVPAPQEKCSALTGWSFSKAKPGEPVNSTTIADIEQSLRPRDILALCEHGRISHGGWNWFSEPEDTRIPAPKEKTKYEVLLERKCSALFSALKDYVNAEDWEAEIEQRAIEALAFADNPAPTDPCASELAEALALEQAVEKALKSIREGYEYHKQRGTRISSHIRGAELDLDEALTRYRQRSSPSDGGGIKRPGTR